MLPECGPRFMPGAEVRGPFLKKGTKLAVIGENFLSWGNGEDLHSPGNVLLKERFIDRSASRGAL
jgi:hypothetical protein